MATSYQDPFGAADYSAEGMPSLLSLSNLESLGRGSIAGLLGLPEDLRKMLVTKKMQENMDFLSSQSGVPQVPYFLPSSEELKKRTPRMTAPNQLTGLLEDIGSFMSPVPAAAAVPLARGVGKVIKATEGMPVGMSIKDVGKGMVKEIPKKSSLLDMTRTPSEAEIKKLSREDLINWLQNNDPNGQYLDPTPSPSISMYQTARGYNIEDAGTGRVFEFSDYNKAKKEFDALRYATSEFQPMTLQEAQESAINYLREFAQPAQSGKVLQLKKKPPGLLD